MNFISRHTLAVLSAALLPGCAVLPMAGYPQDHPANPQASLSPTPEPADALDGYRASTRRKAPAAEPATPGRDTAPGDAAAPPADPTTEAGHEHH